MMCAEEVHEIAKRIGMPTYMFDTDSALFWLSRFAKEAEAPRPEALWILSQDRRPQPGQMVVAWDPVWEEPATVIRPT